jgi:hypothetical protein
VNAHRPSTAQSISRGSRKPSSSLDSGAEKPSASSEASVVVQATVAVAVRAMRSRLAASASSK